MEEKCPKCGETLITRTIKKKLGLGSIDYPIAQICPKCKWSKDITGAGDIVSKPVMADAAESKKPEPEIKPSSSPSSKTGPSSPTGINKFIPIVLAILVVGAIAWVFFLNPEKQEQAIGSPEITPTPLITQTPPVQIQKSTTTTPFPEVTASGKHITVKLETKRGFTPKTATIKSGDEIVWTNEDIYAVTLVSSEGLFEEKFLNNAKRWNHTFMKTGTFGFSLKNDKNLTGIIVVEP